MPMAELRRFQMLPFMLAGFYAGIDRLPLMRGATLRSYLPCSLSDLPEIS